MNQVKQTSAPLVDRFGRVHTYLRISVTDRCNYRCQYCMPEEGLTWLDKSKILSFEEIVKLVEVFASMGVSHIRLTGGEPTTRRGLASLIRQIKAVSGIESIAMTTNGQLFPPLAREFAEAGLTRINLSLDSIRPERFHAITRTGDLERVLRTMELCRELGITPIKVNVVVMKGVNDDEALELVEFFSEHADNTVLRFIEYMPFGDAVCEHVSSETIRKLISERYTVVRTERREGRGPATDWMVSETGLRLGFISPMTEHFCATCNRLRLGPDGHLRTCLSKENTPSLREMVRSGAGHAQLESVIRAMVLNKVEGHTAHLDDGQNFEGVMTQIGG